MYLGPFQDLEIKKNLSLTTKQILKKMSFFLDQITYCKLSFGPTITGPKRYLNCLIRKLQRSPKSAHPNA